jgi:hypothetical protein
MSIQDLIMQDELVKNYRHFLEQKDVYDNAKIQLEVIIKRLEETSNYKEIASEDETETVEDYKSKIAIG